MGVHGVNGFSAWTSDREFRNQKAATRWCAAKAPAANVWIYPWLPGFMASDLVDPPPRVPASGDASTRWRALLLASGGVDVLAFTTWSKTR
jgi:hypothetical protein